MVLLISNLSSTIIKWSIFQTSRCNSLFWETPILWLSSMQSACTTLILSSYRRIRGKKTQIRPAKQIMLQCVCVGAKICSFDCTSPILHYSVARSWKTSPCQPWTAASSRFRLPQFIGNTTTVPHFPYRELNLVCNIKSEKWWASVVNWSFRECWCHFEFTWNEGVF